MLNKLKNILINKGKQSNDTDIMKSNKLLLPNYNQYINYENVISKSANLPIDELQSLNKKGDTQLVELQKASVYIKEGNIDNGLNVYKKEILEKGLYINSQGFIMEYLNTLYKLNKFDEVWSLVGQFELKYPSLEKKYQDFRVKMLKKEKRFKDALYYQVLAILFDNIHFKEIPEDKYQNKYIIILKRLKQQNKQNEIQELINEYTTSKRYDKLNIRNDLKLILNK